MNKILLSFFLLFSSYIYNPIKHEEIDVYVSEEESIYNENIKYKEDKVSFYFNKNYLFSIDLDYDFEKSMLKNFDYLIVENKMYISYLNEGKLYCYAYNDLGSKIFDNCFNQYKYSDENINLFYDGNNVNIICTSDCSMKDYQLLNNVTILKISEKGTIASIETYGGYLNDVFIDALFKDNSLFLFLKREKKSGGDFLNHGNYVLSIIRDGEVVKNTFFNEEDYKNIIFSDDDITISFLNMIYRFDYDFNQILGLKFGRESFYRASSFDKLLLEISETELKIFDLITLDELYVYDYSYMNIDYFLEEVIIFEGSIYLVFTDLYEYLFIRFDVYDTRDFVSKILYLDGLSQYNQEIKGWSGNVQTRMENNNIDLSVDGEYEITYCFDDYYKNMKVIVQEFQNVYEGGIYPLGYVLEFSGTAFLNGKLVNYSYVINSVGEYSLELYNSKKEKRVVNFSVSKDQIFFQNSPYKKSDYTINENQDLILKYSIDCVDVVNLFINSNKWNEWDYNEGILSIKINEKYYGFYIYYLDYIEIEAINGEMRRVNLNEIISVNVIKNEPIISLSYKEIKNSVFLNFQLENGQVCRGLNVYVNDVFYKRINFTDEAIKMPYDVDIYDVRIALIYEFGDKNIYEMDLCELIYSGERIHKIANLNISFLEKNIENFEIELFKESSLKEVNANDKTIYTRVIEDYTVLYIILVIMFLIIFITCIIFVMKYKQNKTRNNI